MNIKEAQQIYIGHYRRFKTLGLKPMTLSAFWDACFERVDQIEVPIFLKRNV